MNNQEVNKVIAEFMGVNYKWIRSENMLISESGMLFVVSNYTKSLDRLVPVWEKLNLRKISPRFALSCSEEKPFYCEIMYSTRERDDWDGSYYSIGETIQQSAAHATAQAIIETNSSTPFIRSQSDKVENE